MSNEVMETKVQKKISERKKYLTYEEAGQRYGLGETTLRRMAKECKALYKIGRSARIKMETFDQYFESFLDESGI